MRKTYSLNNGWRFEKASSKLNNEIYYSASEEIVNLPHTWNVNDNSDRGEYLYQNKLNIPESHKEDALFLEFMGANSVCRVYMNHTFIGEHRGGYSTFRFNITQFYDWSQENILRVYVDNGPTEDVSPLNGDFTIYGGLYRNVNLICTNRTHFDLEYWGSHGIIIRSEVNEDKIGDINLEIHTVCECDARIHLNILDKTGEIVLSQKIPAAQKNVKMRNEKPILWDGKNNPYLYTLKAIIEDEEKVYDDVEMSFGFRSCELTADNGFYLNGSHLRINGVSKHQDFEGCGNAVTKSHINKDFEIIKDIGANAVRLSHYQHNQLVYDICDEEGLVVWAEIPMMSMPNKEQVLKNASDQLKELILQNCHHPSICFWGIQNEIAMDGESIGMYQNVELLNDIVCELLPTGLSASANMYYVKNNSQLNFITDMQGYNHYYGWYYGKMNDLDEWIDGFHEDNPQVALGISEYGADSNLTFHTDSPKVKDYSEEFQALYHEVTYSIINSKPYLWGSFLWNMFDFGSDVRNEGGTKGKNCKGLVTFDRLVKKDAYYFYKANWSDKPFVYICEKRFINRDKATTNIKVYSNLKKVSLRVNGNDVGTLEGQYVFIFENVQLQTGKNIVRAFTDNFEDQSVFFKVDQPDESYIFNDPNPEINVKNWFTQEKGEIDLFPENYYSVLDTLGTLMENEEAWTIVKELAPKVAERSVPGAPVTLLWVANKMKNFFSEEAVKEINERLIKIRKI